MTTSTTRERPTVGEKARAKAKWLWPVVVLVIVAGLLIWSYFASLSNAIRQDMAGTPEQKAGTGNQSSVGLYMQKEGQQGQNNQPGNNANNNNAANNPNNANGNVSGVPLNNPPGLQNQLTAKGTQNNNNQSSGSNIGAGNTGISTSTGTIGGGTVAQPGGNGTSGAAKGNKASSTPNAQAQQSNNGVPNQPVPPTP